MGEPNHLVRFSRSIVCVPHKRCVISIESQQIAGVVGWLLARTVYIECSLPTIDTSGLVLYSGYLRHNSPKCSLMDSNHQLFVFETNSSANWDKGANASFGIRTQTLNILSVLPLPVGLKRLVGLRGFEPPTFCS